MKECINCHEMCDDSEKFCHNCGKEFVMGMPNNNLRYSNVNGYGNVNNTNYNSNQSEGSLVGGFCLGFFLGIIGLLVALLAGFRQNTKKGAICGFVILMILSIIMLATGVYNV